MTMSDSTSPPMNRALSLGEFALGSFIVIGHNVFHIVPNEVPILFILGLVSVRLREGGWAALGLQRPASWPKTILFALAAAALRISLGYFVIDPFTARFWPAQVAPAGSGQIVHNVGAALIGLLIVWTFAAFGEEIGYRGYLTKRGADIGGGSRWAWWTATLAVSVLFGFGHYYKGPAGVLDSAVAGLILGSVYLLSKRNLWTAILAHGFIDTVAVIVVFLGLAD
ncbi:MAG: CPBP family intramembrane glutamic endopeptidase [Rhizomicrobium sp.]